MYTTNFYDTAYTWRSIVVRRHITASIVTKAFHTRAIIGTALHSLLVDTSYFTSDQIYEKNVDAYLD